MTSKQLHEGARVAVASGAMAVCSHREGGTLPVDPKVLVAEIAGSKCKHPGQQVIASACCIASCPIADILAPALVENLGSNLASKVLGKLTSLGEGVTGAVASVAGKLLGRSPAKSMDDAGEPGGVSLG